VELVCLYALHALPASDVPGVEAQMAACAECRQQVEALRPVVESFASWPGDVLYPPASLWERLAERIATETGGERLARRSPPWAEPDWREVAPGISCKLLATDQERNRVSMLVRLAPGTEYPPHRHAGDEELYMLHGDLTVGDRVLQAGDYLHSHAGTVDRRVWTEHGCTGVLLTSFRDAIL
jgi:quercetin dioxygenase-like cupin family protein